MKNTIPKKDIKEIRASLETEKTNLLKELEEIGQRSKKDPNDFEVDYKNIGDDETDNVSEIETYNLELSLEQTLEKALKDVNTALAKLETGDYGVCKYCQQPIDIKRLKARPTSTACVACKEKLKSL